MNVIESPIQGAEGNVEYLALYKNELRNRTSREGLPRLCVLGELSPRWS